MAIQKYIVTKEDRDVAGATYGAYRLTPVEQAADGTLRKSFLALVPKGSAAAQVLEEPANKKVSTIYLTLTKGDPPYILEAMPQWKYEHGLTVKANGAEKLLTGDESLTALSMDHMRWSVMDEQVQGLSVLRTDPEKQALFNAFARDYVSAQIANDIASTHQEVQAKAGEIQEALTKQVPRGFPAALLPAIAPAMLRSSRVGSDASKRVYNFDLVRQSLMCLHEWSVAEGRGAAGASVDLQLGHLEKLGMNREEAKDYLETYRSLSPQSKEELIAVFHPTNAEMLEKASRLNAVRKLIGDLQQTDGTKVGETLLVSQMMSGHDLEKLESVRMGLMQHDPAQPLPPGLLGKLSELAPKEQLSENDYSTESGKLTLTPSGVKTMTALMATYNPAVAAGLAQIASPEFATVLAGKAAELKALENVQGNLKMALAAYQAGAVDRPDTLEAVLGQDRELLPEKIDFTCEGQKYQWTKGQGTFTPSGAPANVEAALTVAGRHYLLDGSGLLRRMAGPAGDITTAKGRSMVQQSDGRVSLVERDGSVRDYPDLSSACKNLGDDSFRGTDSRQYVIKDGEVREQGCQRYNLMADSALDTAEIRKPLTADANGVGTRSPVVDFYTQKALQITLAHQTQNTPITSHLALTTGESMWTHWNPKEPVLTMADPNFFYRDSQGNYVPKQDFVNLCTGMSKYMANQLMGQMSSLLYGKTTQEGPPLNPQLAKLLAVGAGTSPSLDRVLDEADELAEKGLERSKSQLEQRDFSIFKEYGALAKEKVVSMIRQAAVMASLTTVAAGYGVTHMAQDLEH